jgi:hypothetical protein
MNHRKERYMNPMRLKLIACDVLMREVCLLIAKSPHILDVEFTEKDSHNQSDRLRELIQGKIDESEAKDYDAILLGYGVCGNSTMGLVARKTKIIIPRAHDCCTLFLGSRETFKQHFQDNPSQPFSSPGYIERSESFFHDGYGGEDMEKDPRYQQYLEQYGEENARYIYETMYGHKDSSGKLIYIEIPETGNPAYLELCRKRAEESGLNFVLLEGSLAILRKLINGNWTPEDFLTLEPGKRSIGLYDWEQIIESAEIDSSSE